VESGYGKTYWGAGEIEVLVSSRKRGRNWPSEGRGVKKRKRGGDAKDRGMGHTGWLMIQKTEPKLTEKTRGGKRENAKHTRGATDQNAGDGQKRKVYVEETKKGYGLKIARGKLNPGTGRASWVRDEKGL